MTEAQVLAWGQTVGARDLEESVQLLTVASESSGAVLEDQAIALTVVNRMARSGRNAFEVVTGRAGTTGRQRGRPYSTARVPDQRRSAQILARIRGIQNDFTNGAVNFMHPGTQRVLHRRDPGSYSSPERVHERWTTGPRGNLERVDAGVPGIWLYRRRNRPVRRDR